jgi:hypothetical protein
MNEKEKQNLRKLLETHKPEMWKNSPDELKEKLA